MEPRVVLTILYSPPQSDKNANKENDDIMHWD